MSLPGHSSGVARLVGTALGVLLLVCGAVILVALTLAVVRAVL